MKPLPSAIWRFPMLPGLRVVLLVLISMPTGPAKGQDIMIKSSPLPVKAPDAPTVAPPSPRTPQGKMPTPSHQHTPSKTRPLPSSSPDPQTDEDPPPESRLAETTWPSLTHPLFGRNGSPTSPSSDPEPESGPNLPAITERMQLNYSRTPTAEERPAAGATLSPSSSRQGLPAEAVARLDAAYRCSNAQAPQILEPLLASHPGLTEGWILLGNVRYRVGEFDKAKDAFQKALQLDDRHAEAAEFRGKSLVLLGRSSKPYRR